MEDIYKSYLHNPPHLFSPNAVYMVTGAVYQKHFLLRDDVHKALVCNILLERSNFLDWSLEAWAVLGNHYHFVARALGDPSTLVRLIREIHSITARQLNQLDRMPGRHVWYNYWDSCITYEASYLARLMYVHLNPVKHGLVDDAEDYPFCSYRWFLEKSDTDFRERVLVQPIDRVNVVDDF